MNLIKVTPLTKRRTKQIISDLMPWFSYVRITNQGIVILRKKWWHLFKRTVTNITDLYIDVLPTELSRRCQKKGYGSSYSNVFANDIYVMLQLKSYKKSFDIVGYVWKQYDKLIREVPIIQVIATNNIIEESQVYLPIPSSYCYIPGFERFLKTRKTFSQYITEQISKLRGIRILPQFSTVVPNLSYAVI